MLGLVIAVALAPPAVGQPKENDDRTADDSPDSDTRDARARALYLRGDRKYAEGDYEAAVEAFLKAYELSKKPLLLYNLANAYERIGKYEEALARLHEYAPHAPAHEQRTISKRLSHLERRAEQAEAKRRAEPKSVEPKTVDDPLPVSERLPAAELETKPGARPRLGYAALGVGAAGVVGGVLFGMAARSARDEAEALCMHGATGRFCPAGASGALDRDGRNSLLSDVSMGLGLVALGVGSYLTFFRGGDEPGSGSQASLVPTDGGARIQWVTRF